MVNRAHCGGSHDGSSDPFPPVFDFGGNPG